MTTMAERVSPRVSVSGVQPLSTAFMDGLRGLAAVYVLLCHARFLLHEGDIGYRMHSGQYTVIGKAIFHALEAFRYGPEAVMFFFVLSGFVIHLRYAKQLTQGIPITGSDWREYVWRRARRLYPPLFLAIAVTAGLDHLAIALHFPNFQVSPPCLFVNGITQPLHYEGKTLLGNLAFLMQAYVPVWGTNTPLWSLKCEWWFYMIYPAFWPLLRRSAVWPTAIVLALYGLSKVATMPWALPLRDIGASMIVWWMGSLLAEIYVGKIRLRFVMLTPLGLILVLIPAFHIPFIGVGLGVMGIVAGCFVWQARGGSLRTLEKLRHLGDMSYTLYIVHMPIIVFMSGWIMSHSIDNSLPRGFAFFLIGTVSVIAFSYGLHWIVERPFARSGMRR